MAWPTPPRFLWLKTETPFDWINSTLPSVDPSSRDDQFVDFGPCKTIDNSANLCLFIERPNHINKKRWASRWTCGFTARGLSVLCALLRAPSEHCESRTFVP